MTNIYVSGSGNISTYSTTTSSKTLINADKVVKSWLKVVDELYLDQDRNLYGDINGETLIDTEVEDFNTLIYLKNNTLYRTTDNIVVAEQVDKLIFSIGTLSRIEVIYNDVNNQTHYISVNQDGILIYNVIYNYTLKKAYCNFGTSDLFGITEEGELVRQASYYSQSNLSTTGYNGYVDMLYFDANKKGVVLIRSDGKMDRAITGSTYNSYSVVENWLNLSEGEKVIKYYPQYNLVNEYSNKPIYLVKTNERVLTNSNYLTGIDPELIFCIFTKIVNRNTTYFAATSIIEYPLNIYNRDNETIAASVRVLPFNAATITVDGTTATLTLNSVINTTYNVVFQIEKIKGYGFQGLTQIIDSKIPEIVVGNNIGMWGGVLNFYQVYNKVLPNDAVDITSYNMRCEKNRVNKTSWLDKVEDMRGVFRTSVNIEDPVLVIQFEGLPTFNYVYIHNFNRYYFVVGRENVSKDIYAIQLHIDPLFTYKEEIKNIKGEILRSSITSKQNPYIIDRMQPLKNTNIINVYEIDVDVFNNDDQTWKNNFNYVLNVMRALNLKDTHTFEVWKN